MEKCVTLPSMFLLFHLIAAVAARTDPVVHTKVGIIRGRQAIAGNYSMFLGIPYAKVDEANPFGPSIPHPTFETDFEAYNYTPPCPQITYYTNFTGSLHCLSLEVYVPHSATSTNKLPILVWIEGGNFQITRRFGIRDPKYFVRHDVIFIKINFRVGIYGFMCLHTPKVPGNQALKDQTAALRWIKDNIEYFNGDVNKITLMGHSSGGRSVDFHFVFSQEQLFHNIIMQSGTSLTPGTIFDADTEAPLKLAEKLGFQTNKMNEALTFLSAMKPRLVVEAAKDLNLVFMPCIEKGFNNIEKNIEEQTFNSKVPQAKKINILIGHTNREQETRYVNKEAMFFDDYLNVIYNRLRDNFDFEEAELNKSVKLVHKFYLGDKKIGPNTISEIIDFDSFFFYVHPTQRSINMYRENGAKNVYYYVFSYHGNLNALKLLENVTNAGHGDELRYLFDTPSLRNKNLSTEDQLTIDRMTTLWTNFAKYGNPTPEVNELLPVKWLPLTKDTQYYYNIDTKIYLGRRPYHNESAFWDLFYEKNWKLQKGYREKITTDFNYHHP